MVFLCAFHLHLMLFGLRPSIRMDGVQRRRVKEPVSSSEEINRAIKVCIGFFATAFCNCSTQSNLFVYIVAALQTVFGKLQPRQSFSTRQQRRIYLIRRGRIPSESEARPFVEHVQNAQAKNRAKGTLRERFIEFEKQPKFESGRNLFRRKG